MAEFQTLTRILLAAGGAMLPEAMYLLYTDKSSVVSKELKGNSFGDQVVIAKARSVRPNSPASYLFSDDTQLVICISSSNFLRTIHWDDDEEEWIEDFSIPRHQVHPNGNLASSFDLYGRVSVFFQDPSSRLIHLNESWKPTVLPAQPMTGTPLSILNNNVFYISAQDNYMHYVAKGGDGSWTDNILANVEITEKIKRFMVTENGDSKCMEAYMLTQEHSVLLLTAEGQGEKKMLGHVDPSGRFVADTSAESCRHVWLRVKRTYRVASNGYY